MPQTPTGSTEHLQTLVGDLLTRDVDVHADAVEELAEVGDERVVPHLLEVFVIDSIASDWEKFGFPAVLRDRDPPRYLDLPEVSWPGARDALTSLAEPDYDSPHAWVEWESWYSQQDIDPLPGFDDWKLRLYHSYLPPVGGLLDCNPRDFDLQSIRWGNCDRSFLAALNGPDFVPGDHADAAIQADDTVFGFELDGTAYAVPRWVLFPHELMNADLQGTPVSLTYCTLCNAPILYDRRIGGSESDDEMPGGNDSVRTFGSTGMLASGNKVMYDEETETLWDQHAGIPIGGHHLDADANLVLDQFAVTQTTWADWQDEYPESRILDLETGYDYDYSFYHGDVGFFEHYWTKEEVVQPGVRRAEGALPEKESVYGIVSDDGHAVWVIPVDDLAEDDVLVGEAAGTDVVALLDATGDVAVYEAPPTPVERVEGGLRDDDGTVWRIGRNELRVERGEEAASGEGAASGDESETRDRVVGRHGLWFAFRTHYDEAHVLR